MQERILCTTSLVITSRSRTGPWQVSQAAPAVGVHTVAEVDESREPIDADPGNRLLLFGGGGQLLDVRTVGLDRLVTAHAETLRGIPHELAGVGVLVA